MSDAEPSGDLESPAAKPADGATRKTVLYGVFAIMLVAITYDYFIARPAVDTAYDQIADASVKANASGVDFLSSDDVHQLIGKTPSDTFMDGNQTVEVYHWTSGLVVKPHKLFAVYKQSGDDLLFYRHAKFIYEAKNQVSGQGGVVEMTVEEAEALARELEAGMSDAEGGGGGGPRDGGADEGGRGPRGGERPEITESTRPAMEESTDEETSAETESGGDSAQE